ncbi:RNA 2',3'-cyclic phosphodiesterase [Cupriavidus yeoncheonensis]|uniref:RNA 2',3'-cyclic phosphodiesterase n=1 Tax=Cupriavidus yeoncheonensis TaxID=1462994 RepID=A0A916MVU8_9BURK|nr:RNA 2',3'-cyclic phosphodiesterase [Cupriavidus yeoncheonensis]CAG2145848.1 RNA 2',3'-cyclic phosphodiesterase [Cupriavidus yeoncheonensis]
MARLFIAVETPRTVAAHLVGIVPAARGIRPAPAAQVHLTLRFLGECDAGQAERITAALDALRAADFALRVTGAGRFRGQQGSVLWAGLAPCPALDALYGALTDALQSAGIAPERRQFRAHLTLARCRPTVPDALLRDWVAAHRELAVPSWQARRFILFESRLDRHGATHEAIGAWPLMAPDDAHSMAGVPVSA